MATSEGDPIPELGKELISVQGPLASVDGVESLSFLSVQEQYAEIVEEAYHREKESKPRTKYFTEEPSEVKAHILEVSPNLPLGPIQIVKAAEPSITSIELTPQFSVEPKLAPLDHHAGVDVGAFHMSWREVRKMRQAETVDKYKQKLQKEVDVSFLFCCLHSSVFPSLLNTTSRLVTCPIKLIIYISPPRQQRNIAQQCANCATSRPTSSTVLRTADLSSTESLFSSHWRTFSSEHWMLDAGLT